MIHCLPIDHWYTVTAMNLLSRIRRSAATLSRVNLALFALVWISIVVAPCAMAMQLQAEVPEHDCPHCPPTPCDEMAPEQCDAADGIDSLRLGDSTQTVLAPATEAALPAPFDSRHAAFGITERKPPARAGPRIHLVHVRFHE
jgi:hypothetical protein